MKTGYFTNIIDFKSLRLLENRSVCKNIRELSQDIFTEHFYGENIFILYGFFGNCNRAKAILRRKNFHRISDEFLHN